MKGFRSLQNSPASDLCQKEDILIARGTDERVVDKNNQNKFRDKDLY